MGTLTGCSIQLIEGGENPNQGRIKINNNFTNLCTSFTEAIDVITGHTKINNGTNIVVTDDGLTAGTTYNVSLEDNIYVNDLLSSGNTTANSLTATTLSGGTIFSGSTDLYDIFAPAGTTGLTLSEILSNGNTTSGTGLDISSNDAINFLGGQDQNKIVLDGASGFDSVNFYAENDGYFITTSSVVSQDIGVLLQSNAITLSQLNNGGKIIWADITSGFNVGFNISTPTANRNISLPDASGTIALISDIATSTGETTASNGLTKTGDNITLGGALTGDTYIDNSGNLLRSDTFSADTMSAQTIHVSNLSGFSPINLGADMLIPNDFVFSGGTGNIINLNLFSGKSGLNDGIVIGTDGGTFSDTQLYIKPDYSELSSYSSAGAVSLRTNESILELVDNYIKYRLEPLEPTIGSIGLEADTGNAWFGIEPSGTGSDRAYNILSTTGNTSTYDINNFPVSISSRKTIIGSGIINTVIAGGRNMNATENDSLYTQNARLGENNGIIYSAGTDLYNIFSSTANNGLTKTSSNIALGGTLKQNTTINGVNHNFTLTKFGNINFSSDVGIVDIESITSDVRVSAPSGNVILTADTIIKNLQIDNGLSIPSSKTSDTGNTEVILTTEDYYVRSLTTSGDTVYKLPTNPSGSAVSKDGQMLIIAIGDSSGTVSIESGVSGAIEEPSSSVDKDEIELTGPNSNVTLYYDGGLSKWIVISQTGTISYINNP